MSKKEPKVAIVHDWLVGYAGGDRVVDAMKRVFLHPCVRPQKHARAL